MREQPQREANIHRFIKLIDYSAATDSAPSPLLGRAGDRAVTKMVPWGKQIHIQVVTTPQSRHGLRWGAQRGCWLA